MSASVHLSLPVTLPASGMSWLTCPTVRHELSLVEAGIRKAASTDDPLMLAVCTHLINAGGKRLRPALVLLAAQFARGDEPWLVSTAVAVELLHLASLYHDDIIDEARTRRDVASVNATWGNRIATFGGNYLFSRSTELLARAGAEVNRTLSEAIIRVWEGQMQETESAYNLDLDEGRYFEIVEKKTATLYELPCRLGAIVSGATVAQAQALSDYGRDLGIAFQVTDDALDIATSGSSQTKTPGTDLQEGVYTLPVIYTLALDDPARDKFRAILARTKLEQAEIGEALAILRNNGSVHYTVGIARKFAESAKGRLASLAKGEARESLEALADSVIDRVSPE